MSKDQQISNVTEIRKRYVPFSAAMQKKILRMNTIANTLSDVAKGAEAVAQAAQVALQDYLLYCREELGAPEDHYELKRIDVGFELKSKDSKEDLDGIQ